MRAYPTSQRGFWRSTLIVVPPALALVIGAWVFVFALINHDREQTIAHQKSENSNLSLAFEQHTIRTLKSVDQLLKYVRREFLARGGPDFDLPEVQKAIELDHELLNAVLIIDRLGNVLYPRVPGAVLNLAEREYFAYHRDHPGDTPRIGLPLQGAITGTPGFPLTRRIEGVEGAFEGVVLAGINPRYFTDFYGSMDLGRHGMVLLVGLDGITRARRVGRESSSGQDMRESKLLQEQASAATGSFLSTGRIDGVRRFTSYRTLPEYGLVLAVGTSEGEALADYASRRRNYLAGAAIFTLLVFGFTGVVLVLRKRRLQLMDERLRTDARFHATFDQAAVGMAHVGLDGSFMRVNGKLCDMTGYPAQELVGRKFTDFKWPEEREAAEEERRKMLATGSREPSEHRYRRKDGSEFWANVAISLVRDPEGKPDYFVAVAQDITAQRQAQETVFHQATHDLLTDLPNRAMFHDRLRKALGQAHRHGWTGGVLFMDLDKFKQVNDSFGHAAGDALLREVAGRLRHCVRAEDTAARIGGDEFAVVLAEVSHARDAAVVAQKILEEMAAPMLLEGHRYELTVSIGITLFPADGDEVERLLRNADEAMFRAKQAGRNRFLFHDAAMGAQAA